MRLRPRACDVRCERDRQDVVTKHRYLVDQTKLFKVDEGAADAARFASASSVSPGASSTRPTARRPSSSPTSATA